MRKRRDTFLRSYPLDDITIQRGGDGRTVTAYAAIFDTPYEVRDQYGHYMERIERSAFNRTLKNGWHKVACLYNHGLTVHGTPDMLGSVPIGTPLEIKADGRGLLTVTRYNKSELADAVLEAIRNGDIRSQSFRGQVYRSTPTRPPRYQGAGPLPLVVRHELGLTDYGPTPVPVNPAAEIVAVRSVDQLAAEIEQLDEEEVEELLRHLPGRHRQASHGNRYRIPGDRSSGLRHKGRSKLDDDYRDDRDDDGGSSREARDGSGGRASQARRDRGESGAREERDTPRAEREDQAEEPTTRDPEAERQADEEQRREGQLELDTPAQEYLDRVRVNTPWKVAETPEYTAAELAVQTAPEGQQRAARERYLATRRAVAERLAQEEAAGKVLNAVAGVRDAAYRDPAVAAAMRRYAEAERQAYLASVQDPRDIPYRDQRKAAAERAAAEALAEVKAAAEAADRSEQERRRAAMERFGRDGDPQAMVDALPSMPDERLVREMAEMSHPPVDPSLPPNVRAAAEARRRVEIELAVQDARARALRARLEADREFGSRAEATTPEQREALRQEKLRLYDEVQAAEARVSELLRERRHAEGLEERARAEAKAATRAAISETLSRIRDEIRGGTVDADAAAKDAGKAIRRELKLPSATKARQMAKSRDQREQAIAQASERLVRAAEELAKARARKQNNDLAVAAVERQLVGGGLRPEVEADLRRRLLSGQRAGIAEEISYAERELADARQQWERLHSPVAHSAAQLYEAEASRLSRMHRDGSTDGEIEAQQSRVAALREAAAGQTSLADEQAMLAQMQADNRPSYLIRRQEARVRALQDAEAAATLSAPSASTASTAQQTAASMAATPRAQAGPVAIPRLQNNGQASNLARQLDRTGGLPDRGALRSTYRTILGRVETILRQGPARVGSRQQYYEPMARTLREALEHLERYGGSEQEKAKLRALIDYYDPNRRFRVQAARSRNAAAWLLLDTATPADAGPGAEDSPRTGHSGRLAIRRALLRAKMIERGIYGHAQAVG